MKLEIFDDRRGTVFHVLAGGTTLFFPAMFVIFMAYEFLEHIYCSGKEEEANFLGDILEFSFGVMLLTMLDKLLGVGFGTIVFAVFVLFLYLCMGRWDNELRKNPRKEG